MRSLLFPGAIRTFRPVLQLALAAMLTGTLGGCVDRDPSYEDPLDTANLLEVGQKLLVLNPARQRVEVIAANGTDVQTSSFGLKSRPEVVLTSADGSRVVLLDVERRELALLTVDGVKTWPLQAEFTGLALSDDGSQAVLYHSASGQAVSSIVSTDQIALVDLAAAPSTANPRLATLAGLSRAPVAAHIGPEVKIGAIAHRLVWVEVQNALGVADFSQGEVRTTMVPLAADPTANIRPARTVARIATGGTDLYVIANGLDDVIHVRIDQSAQDLGVSLDQIASGSGPADLHVFETKEGLRVFTVNAGSRDVALLDPATGTNLAIPLQYIVNRIVPYLGQDGLQHALLLRGDATVFTAYVVDLDDLAKRKGKALHLVTFDHGIGQVVQAGPRFFVRPVNVAGLTVLDPDTRNKTAFNGAGVVTDLRVSGDAVFVLGKVDGQSRLSRIDAATLQGSSLTLGHVATRLTRLGQDGIAVAGTGVAGWWIAAFPTGVLDQASGRWVEGFALQGVSEGW